MKAGFVSRHWLESTNRVQPGGSRLELNPATPLGQPPPARGVEASTIGAQSPVGTAAVVKNTAQASQHFDRVSTGSCASDSRPQPDAAERRRPVAEAW